MELLVTVMKPGGLTQPVVPIFIVQFCTKLEHTTALRSLTVTDNSAIGAEFVGLVSSLKKVLQQKHSV